MPTGLKDLLRHVPAGLADLLRHVPTGLKDLQNQATLTFRNSEFLYEIPFDYIAFIISTVLYFATLLGAASHEAQIDYISLPETQVRTAARVTSCLARAVVLWSDSWGPELFVALLRASPHEFTVFT